MGFKDMVAADIHDVFLNLGEFAEARTVWYDGKFYENIPIVLHGLKENDRKRLTSGVKEQGGRNSIADRVEGLWSESRVAHMALSDVGGILPEKGKQFRISTGEGTQKFRTYRITASVLDMGMCRLELGVLTE
jgi:hypothetical protein